MDLKIEYKRRRNVRGDIRTLVNKSLLDTALSVSASVVMSLLLLSGDIEENPGPGSQGVQLLVIIIIWIEMCMLLSFFIVIHCALHSYYNIDLDYNTVDSAQILGRYYILR